MKEMLVKHLLTKRYVKRNGNKKESQDVSKDGIYLSGRQVLGSPSAHCGAAMGAGLWGGLHSWGVFITWDSTAGKQESGDRHCLCFPVWLWTSHSASLSSLSGLLHGKCCPHPAGLLGKLRSSQAKGASNSPLILSSNSPCSVGGTCTSRGF